MARDGLLIWDDEDFIVEAMPLNHLTVSMAYKVTDFYSPSGERTILWNDPRLAIPWPVDEREAIVSDKDRQGSSFDEAEVFP